MEFRGLPVYGWIDLAEVPFYGIRLHTAEGRGRDLNPDRGFSEIKFRFDETSIKSSPQTRRITKLPHLGHNGTDIYFEVHV